MFDWLNCSFGVIPCAPGQNHFNAIMVGLAIVSLYTSARFVTGGGVFDDADRVDKCFEVFFILAGMAIGTFFGMLSMMGILNVLHVMTVAGTLETVGVLTLIGGVVYLAVKKPEQKLIAYWKARRVKPPGPVKTNILHHAYYDEPCPVVVRDPYDEAALKEVERIAPTPLDESTPPSYPVDGRRFR